MRWPFFMILAYLLLGIQTGLSSLLTLGRGIEPSLLLILVVYVAMFAPRRTVLWAFAVAGVLTDLVTQLPAFGSVSEVLLLGPNTLAFIVGGWVSLQLRGIVRRSLLGVATMVFLVGVFIHLTVVVVLTMRGMPWPLGEPIPDWSALDELVRRFGCLLYTTGISLLLLYLLGRLQRGFGFHTSRKGPQTGYVLR